MVKTFFVEFFFNGKYPEINSDIIKLNEYNYDLTITIISISIFGFFLGSFISKKLILMYLNLLIFCHLIYFIKNIGLVLFYYFLFLL